MEKSKALARANWKGSGDSAVEDIWFSIKDRLGITEFLGYETNQAEGTVLSLLKNNKEDRRLVKEYCERNSDYRHTVKPIWKKCCGALERYNVIIKKNKDPLWKQRLKS